MYIIRKGLDTQQKQMQSYFILRKKKGDKNGGSNLGFSLTIEVFKNVCFHENRLTLNMGKY